MPQASLAKFKVWMSTSSVERAPSRSFGRWGEDIVAAGGWCEKADHSQLAACHRIAARAQIRQIFPTAPHLCTTRHPTHVPQFQYLPASAKITRSRCTLRVVYLARLDLSSSTFSCASLSSWPLRTRKALLRRRVINPNRFTASKFGGRSRKLRRPIRVFLVTDYCGSH